MHPSPGGQPARLAPSAASAPRKDRVRRSKAGVTLLLLLVMALAPGLAATAAPPLEAGDTVIVSGRSTSASGYAGSAMFGIYTAGSDTSGPPDFWAYCIEQTVGARQSPTATVGDASSFLGDNYFSTDPVARAKVYWVLANSYPAVSLAQLGAAAGVSGLAQDDATEATQYAIWRFTDVTWDAAWPWESDDSRDVYWYLVNGANASGGLSAADLQVTATITPPAAPQTAGSLVGPFTVATNQAAVQVEVSPAADLVDADGAAVDASAVVDGQQLYLDHRGTAVAGSATLTVTAQGATAGQVISVPQVEGVTPTDDSHAQSLILAVPGTATTEVEAEVTWRAAPEALEPSIGTSLVDQADGDRVLPWTGGTVVDTVSYSGLAVGVEHTITGELMVKGDGSATGITGSVTFVPTASSGSADVTFVVPAGYAGMDLVAFEWLYLGPDGSGDLIAEHTDLDDPAQTVSVERQPEPEPESTTTTEAGAGGSTTTTEATSGATTTAPAASGTGTGTGTGTGSGSGSLPRTGTGVGGPLALGALLLALGGASIGLSRTHRRSTLIGEHRR